MSLLLVQTEAAAKLQVEVDALRASKAASDSLAGGKGREAADLAEQLAASRMEAEEARSRVATLEGVRRSLHNTVLVREPWLPKVSAPCCILISGRDPSPMVDC